MNTSTLRRSLRHPGTRRASTTQRMGPCQTPPTHSTSSPAKAAETVTFWYLYSRDAHTNEAFARKLGEADGEINTAVEKECHDHVKRNLWYTTHAYVAECERSRASANLDFWIFVQEGQHALPKPWKFEKK